MHIRSSIFISIFLCSWLTVLILVATLSILDNITISGPKISRFSRTIRNTLVLFGQKAVEFMNGGRRNG